MFHEQSVMIEWLRKPVRPRGWPVTNLIPLFFGTRCKCLGKREFSACRERLSSA